MPDPSTPRISLYKSKSDGSELVTYTLDVGQNWDRVDAAVGFQAVTSTTRPSTPYSGKGIFQTDTGYGTFVHNGTSPASAGWVEIPNSSAAYTGRFVTLFPGSTVGTSLMRLAQTGAASGSRAFAARGSGDTADHFFFDFDGRIQWGAGGAAAADTNLYRSAANTLTTDDNFVVGIDLKLAGGTTIHRNALAVAAGATVANTVTETAVGTMTIPAADAVPGAIYRARMIANVSFLASATLTWRARIGGLAGVVIGMNGPTTLSATPQTLKEVAVEVDLVCVSAGASGTWFSMFQEVRNTLGTGSVGDVQLNSTDGTIVRDTTIANDFVITAQWGAASASNTLTGRVIFERIA